MEMKSIPAAAAVIATAEERRSPGARTTPELGRHTTGPPGVWHTPMRDQAQSIRPSRRGEKNFALFRGLFHRRGADPGVVGDVEQTALGPLEFV
jgi:hypothetical protein